MRAHMTDNWESALEKIRVRMECLPPDELERQAANVLRKLKKEDYLLCQIDQKK